jgi:hypothetical protein
VTQPSEATAPAELGGKLSRTAVLVGALAVALIAAAVAVALRHVRAGAVKAGGDLRGTALIEDVSGFVAAVVALIPFVGYVMLAAAGALVARARQREQEKYKGLRVLR